MSEEYNPQARVLEQVEKIEVELKELVHKRDATEDDAEKGVIQKQIDELKTRLRQLREKLD